MVGPLLEVSVEYTNMNGPTKLNFVWDLSLRSFFCIQWSYLVANIDLCFIYFWVLDQFCFVSFTFKISFLPPLLFVFSNSVIFSAVAMKWVLRLHTYASIKFAWASHVNRWNIFWISNVIVNGWIDEQVYVVGYISQS
jgi:hypothetical protein